MNKQKLLEALESEAKAIQGRIKKADGLEQGKLYEFDWYSSPVIGIIKGFSYGVMSCGVVVEILATKDEWRAKSVTIPLYDGLKITPVSYSDLPKYLSWKVTHAYEKRLKNITRYIKKEQSQ